MGRAENWTSNITKQSWAISFFFGFLLFILGWSVCKIPKGGTHRFSVVYALKLNYKAIETHKDHPRSNNLHAIQWYKKEGKKRESV